MDDLSLSRVSRRRSGAMNNIIVVPSAPYTSRANTPFGMRPGLRSRTGSHQSPLYHHETAHRVSTSPIAGAENDRDSNLPLSNLHTILNGSTAPSSPVCVTDPSSPDEPICPVEGCTCPKSTQRSYRTKEVPRRVRELQIVLLVSSINSFTQLVYAKLKERASEYSDVAIKIFSPGSACAVGSGGNEELLEELRSFGTDIILCPFLTAKVPAEIYEEFLTLVVHPGPPGDVGPSALDWMLLGDDGSQPDPAVAMRNVRDSTSSNRIRGVWGCIVFQADEEMDKGPLWAWEEYTIDESFVTKGHVYHFGHSPAAWRALDTALHRVVETAVNGNFYRRKFLHHHDDDNGMIPAMTLTEDLSEGTAWISDLPPLSRESGSMVPDIQMVVAPPWVSATWASQLAPQPEWAKYPVTKREPNVAGFSGGNLVHRPMIKVADRQIDWGNWTGDKIKQFVSAFDSQPGAGYNPNSSSTKKLFIYGAHLQIKPPPRGIWGRFGSREWLDVPNGTLVAQRDGAILFKTHSLGPEPFGVWITHGRVLRPAGSPIGPKIPLVDALKVGGHESLLSNVLEWNLLTPMERPGFWQEVYVRSFPTPAGIVQFVYWSFYNGAFSTKNCKKLLEVLQWATDPARAVPGIGGVAAVALMGGQYFSNGIALNTIEAAKSQTQDGEHPEYRAGLETWENINAIDDIVEFLAGDLAQERSSFLEDKETLCERGIITIAAIRGNAAAGGVALAAACDMVLASDHAVLNPAYRAMGLHGSEFHSWSYRERCGEANAASMLREMLPMSADAAAQIGLVDLVITRPDGDTWAPHAVHDELWEDRIVTLCMPDVHVRAAPWCSPFRPDEDTTFLNLEMMVKNKVEYYTNGRAIFTRPPLLHYRNEELSQMLLDCFHPTRAERYHSRRRAFIGKIKCGKTPSRYAPVAMIMDEENLLRFDEIEENWVRGSEWHFVNMAAPMSLHFSAWTRVCLYPESERFRLLPPQGYQYAETLSYHDKGYQRIRVTCSHNPSLDSHDLCRKWGYFQERVPETFQFPSRRRSTCADVLVNFDAFVIPQLEEIDAKEMQKYDKPCPSLVRTYVDKNGASVLEEAIEEAMESQIGDSDADVVPVEMEMEPRTITPTPSIEPGPEAIEFPFPRSAAAPAPTPRAMTPVQAIQRIAPLPFSRSASPAPLAEQAQLGSTMLQQIMILRDPQEIVPPPAQNRRYSRLNTGEPDLLSRARTASAGGTRY